MTLYVVDKHFLSCGLNGLKKRAKIIIYCRWAEAGNENSQNLFYRKTALRAVNIALKNRYIAAILRYFLKSITSFFSTILLTKGENKNTYSHYTPAPSALNLISYKQLQEAMFPNNVEKHNHNSGAFTVQRVTPWAGPLLISCGYTEAKQKRQSGFSVCLRGQRQACKYCSPQCIASQFLFIFLTERDF